MSNIKKSANVADDLSDALNGINYDKLFVLTDENTNRLCLPVVHHCQPLNRADVITIAAGDDRKNIENLSYIWQQLSNRGATRHSLLVNIGGGMITDIGGFAAATFKRGINYINVPTTLLGAVDAAVGGKTGINFNGYKNEVGAFHHAQLVIISSAFFNTLEHEQILSGYAEMLKHSLIDSERSWQSILDYNLNNIDYARLADLLYESVSVKQSVVENDPYEKGYRKALNLGHTVGHAFESMAMHRAKPVPHGFTVAWGLIAELYLSHRLCNFPIKALRETVKFVGKHYGAMPIDCSDYEQLYDIMTHDKKNENSVINFTLLSDIGQVRIDCKAEKSLIFESLDFYRDTVGL